MQLLNENWFITSIVLLHQSKLHEDTVWPPRQSECTVLSSLVKQHIHEYTYADLKIWNSKTQHVTHRCVNSSFDWVKATEMLQQKKRLFDISSSRGLEEESYFGKIVHSWTLMQYCFFLMFCSAALLFLYAGKCLLLWNSPSRAKSGSPVSSRCDIHNLLGANSNLLWMNASTAEQLVTEWDTLPNCRDSLTYS